MIKQLRKRIMMTMFLMLSIIFISIIIAINIWSSTRNRTEADDRLKFLVQREIRTRNDMRQDMPNEIPDDRGNQTPDKAPDDLPPDRELSFNEESENSTPAGDRRMEIGTAHFILVRYDSQEQLTSIENTLSDIYADEEIEQYCTEILNNGNQNGTISNLRYNIDRNNSGTVIAFLDYTAAEQSRKNLLTISIILGIVGLAAFAFLSYLISGLMVQPVENAFEKQKQFISDASHELKTPITVILSNSELLEDQIGENKQLSYIKKECDQMHHLVTSLLTLTHLEQTPYTNADKNTFSLSDALLEQVLPMESVAFEKGIMIQEEIAPDISFYGVKEQLQQVATILIDNALNYSPQGEKVDITLQKTPHHIVFTVSNVGEEIPLEEREKLFERFYRQDKARNRASGHFGLGLSIAKTIVTNHKGRIHIECKNGINSFIVTLKATEK